MSNIWHDVNYNKFIGGDEKKGKKQNRRNSMDRIENKIQGDGLSGREAVIYYRVSSEEQEEDGRSLPAQLDLCRDYANKHNLKVLEEFKDVETAKQAGRENFNRMLQFFRDRPTCKIVLVEKTDRLYRNLKDWITLDDLGIELHFVKENVVYSENVHSSQKLFHGLKVLMAKHYIDNLGEEVLKGMKRRAMDGIFPSATPIGYSYEDKKMVPDKDLAPLVLWLYRECATNKYSSNDLVKKCKEKGFKSKKGHSLTKSTILHVLKNKVYTGKFDYLGVEYPGKHDPIVPEELWANVQRVLEKRASGRTRYVKHNLTYSRLITCGECGGVVSGDKKERCVEYRCNHNKGPCQQRYISERKIEVQFVDYLKRIDIGNEELSMMGEALRLSHGDEKKFREDTVTRLQAEFKKYDDRMDKLYDDRTKGDVGEDFYSRKMKQWQEEQKRISSEIMAHQRANNAYLEEGVRILKVASKAYTLFMEGEEADKQSILKVLFEGVTLKDGVVTPSFRPLFLMLVNNSSQQNPDFPNESKEIVSGVKKWLPGTNDLRTVKFLINR